MTTRPAVTLRRSTPDDAAAYTRVMGHPAVYPMLMQLPFADEADWRRRLADNGPNDLPLVALLDGEVVGTAGLHIAPALRRRHVGLIGIGVLPEAQGRGVGRALMGALCDYADHWAQLLRIELGVYADNLRAIALYRSLGFALEGTHRGHALRGGVYVDSLSMARLHPNPPRIATAG